MTDLAPIKAVIRRYLTASYISYKARVKKYLQLYSLKNKREDGEKNSHILEHKTSNIFQQKTIWLFQITTFFPI